MKNPVLFAITLAVIGIGTYMSSCKKASVYSCDKGINQYVSEMIDVNQSITRDSLAKIGIDTQFAIFNSLTAANKIRVFKEKFDLLMRDETIPAADKEHIKTLRDGVSEDIYLGEENEAWAFVANWRIQALEEFHWDSLKLYLYTETWLSSNEFTYYTDIGEGGTGIGGGGQLPCKCASRFACGFGLYSCKSGGCKQTTSGCGIIGRDPCTGDCDYWH